MKLLYMVIFLIDKQVKIVLILALGAFNFKTISLSFIFHHFLMLSMSKTLCKCLKFNGKGSQSP